FFWPKEDSRIFLACRIQSSRSDFEAKGTHCIFARMFSPIKPRTRRCIKSCEKSLSMVRISITSATSPELPFPKELHFFSCCHSSPWLKRYESWGDICCTNLRRIGLLHY